MHFVARFVLKATLGTVFRQVRRNPQLILRVPGAQGIAEELARRKAQRAMEAEALHADEAEPATPAASDDATPNVPEPDTTTEAGITVFRAQVEDAPAHADPVRAATPRTGHADPADLVEAERQLLTVPGPKGHRLRNQTAGAAAREIAAAQVSARRNR